MTKLQDFRPLLNNPNNHTEKGMRLLRESIERNGYTEAMVAAADGTILSGNARLETVGDMMAADPIVVKSDGTRPIIIQREDISDAESMIAQRIVLASNRVPEMNLDNDEVILEQMLDALNKAGEMRGSGFELNSNFSPSLEPEISTGEYTGGDVEEAQTKLEEKMNGKEKLLPVICPKCGNEFEIRNE